MDIWIYVTKKNNFFYCRFPYMFIGGTLVVGSHLRIEIELH
jgi:hypothetical protein